MAHTELVNVVAKLELVVLMMLVTTVGIKNTLILVIG